MASIVEEASNGEKKLECLGFVFPEQSETLDGLLHNAYSIRVPKPSNYHDRSELVRIFNVIAKEIFGNSTNFLAVKEFGSYLMDMFSCDSDLDLSVNFSHEAIDFPREKKKQVLRKFGKKLYGLQARGHVLCVQTIFTARVPILKVTDRGSGIECDISVENRDGIIKSEIIRMVSFIDERFKKLAFLMKVWAKTHKINSSKDKTLNSLSIISLVAFHLQNRSPPILPPFSAFLGDGADAASVWKIIEEFKNYAKNNKESLAELFVSMFSLVEDFCERSENVARAVGVAGVKRIYDCINHSISDFKAFKDGRMDGVKLMESLFGKESEIGKPSPLDSMRTKRKKARALPKSARPNMNKSPNMNKKMKFLEDSSSTACLLKTVHPNMNKKMKFPEDSFTACLPGHDASIVGDPGNGNGAKTSKNDETTLTHLYVPLNTQLEIDSEMWVPQTYSKIEMKFIEDSSSTPSLPELISPIVGDPQNGNAPRIQKNNENTLTHFPKPPNFTQTLTESKNCTLPKSPQTDTKWKTKFTEGSSSSPCHPSHGNGAKASRNEKKAPTCLSVPPDFTANCQNGKMWAPPNLGHLDNKMSMPNHSKFVMPNQLGSNLPAPGPLRPQVLGFGQPQIYQNQYYQNQGGQWSFQMPDQSQTSLYQNPNQHPWG